MQGGHSPSDKQAIDSGVSKPLSGIRKFETTDVRHEGVQRTLTSTDLIFHLRKELNTVDVERKHEIKPGEDEAEVQIVTLRRSFTDPVTDQRVRAANDTGADFRNTCTLPPKIEMADGKSGPNRSQTRETAHTIYLRDACKVDDLGNPNADRAGAAAENPPSASTGTEDGLGRIRFTGRISQDRSREHPGGGGDLAEETPDWAPQKTAEFEFVFNRGDFASMALAVSLEFCEAAIPGVAEALYLKKTKDEERGQEKEEEGKE